MSKLLVGSIILIVAGIILISISLSSDSNITGNAVLGSDSKDNLKTFVMTGENFKFVMNGSDNPDIIVNEGDKIRIEFRSTKGFHDWVVDEFNASTMKIRETDESTFVEFVADKKGTYEYYCSVGKHRANGMKGNLIVK